jgi:hypothetical protein
MQMADNMHPGHAVPNESRVLLKTGIKVLMLLVPGWKAPKLAHPHAKAYDDEFQLLEDIKPGDQVMVRTSAGYYHHGIYVGKQQMADSVRHAVVDFWGSSKEDATIAVRPLDAFVRGATGFAKADYPPGGALEHELTVRLALAWAERDKTRPTLYNVALKNCEVFATICRCMRCGPACHCALRQQLALMVVRPSSSSMGFK